MCNPLSLGCNAPTAYGDYGNNNYQWNFCELDTPLGPMPAGYAQWRQEAYKDTCNPPMPVASIYGCGFCVGTEPAHCTYPNTPGYNGSLVPNGIIHHRCQNIGDVMVRPPGCSCILDGEPCVSSGNCCTSVTGQAKKCDIITSRCRVCDRTLGDLCEPGVNFCCGSGGANNAVCSDGICVPIVEPPVEN